MLGFISGLFRDGYVIHCYSASVIVMLLMFPGVMVSFLCTACSHFGCFPAVALRGVGGGAANCCSFPAMSRILCCVYVFFMILYTSYFSTVLKC